VEGEAKGKDKGKDKDKDEDKAEGKVLGVDPVSGERVRVRVGRYGAYLQLGESEPKGKGKGTGKGTGKGKGKGKGKGTGKTKKLAAAPAVLAARAKARTQTLPQSLGGCGGGNFDRMLELDLQTALEYLGLPRTVGRYGGGGGGGTGANATEAESDEITAGVGKFGPWLKYGKKYCSLPEGEFDVLTVGGGEARELVRRLIVEKVEKRGGSTSEPLVDYGDVEGSKLTVLDGRFGVYVKCKKINVGVPKEWRESVESMPMQVAWEAIRVKEGKVGEVASPKKAKAKAKAKGKGKGKGAPKKAKPTTKKGNGKGKDKGEAGTATATVTVTVTEKKPKRKVSNYIKFCQALRAEAVEAEEKEKEKVMFGQVTKRLAGMWRELSNEEKAGWGNRGEEVVLK